MKKGRSPNYPRITLEDALSKIKRVYEQNHNYTAGKEVVAKSLGYTSINGGSLTMFGALKAYDLLESEGEGLKVSNAAVDLILLPQEDERWYENFNHCLSSPEIFREINEKFDGSALPSDSLIKHFLVSVKGYLEKAASEVIRVYRANIEFANSIGEKYNFSVKPESANKDIPSQQPIIISPSANKFYRGGYARPIQENVFSDKFESNEPTNSNQELKFRLSSDSDVKLIFRGEVTQQAVTKLIKLLELSMDTFPSETDLSKETKRIEGNKDAVIDTQEIENKMPFG